MVVTGVLVFLWAYFLDNRGLGGRTIRATDAALSTADRVTLTGSTTSSATGSL